MLARLRYFRFCCAAIIALTFLVLVLTAISLKSTYGGKSFGQLSLQLDSATVKTIDDHLITSTGAVERKWKWTGKGLLTTSLIDLSTQRQWAGASLQYMCDFSLPGIIDDTSEAKLVNLTAEISDDNGFTSEHIEVVVEIEYPASNLLLQYVIWLYPDSPGIRTQLRVKALEGFQAPANKSIAGRIEHVPVSVGNLQRRAIGYYNHTQFRNLHETEILKEEFVSEPLSGKEIFDWASILCVEDSVAGLCLVKESHKCVNQQGVDTGSFECDKTAICSTGWAIKPKDFSTDSFNWCWPSWVIVYPGGDINRQLAIKQFDRIRYPLDRERDIYILANTWGSTDNADDARNAAGEKNVITEIKSQADLGIDVQQVDDGWQNPPSIGGGFGAKTWRPDTHSLRYPKGWGGIRQTAKEHNITLGLWAMDIIGLDDLIWNYQEGGFKYYKLDFINLENYQQLKQLIAKVRGFIEYTNHDVRVNWDVTENPPRVGYFFGREYGNVYLENRKPNNVPVTYKPYLVLRDAWQVSKYVNLNKFQVTVQNPERTNPERSDAYLHSHPYTVAITLMASPIFFQETHYYTQQACEQIKQILAIYKQHRQEIYDGFVFPIGQKPDNQSWTGFQCYRPGSKSGYLTIFRELNNTESQKAISINSFSAKKIRLTNLRTNEMKELDVSDSGDVIFKIDKPADFRFFRYELLME